MGLWGLPGHTGGSSWGPILTSLQYMEKLSQLAYHPLKMQSCYEKMDPLRLDGLQQRFDVSSTSVFKQRAQIHMREVGLRLLPQHPPHLPSTVPISGGHPHPTPWAQPQVSHMLSPGVCPPVLVSSARPTCLEHLSCSPG